MKQHVTVACVLVALITGITPCIHGQVQLNLQMPSQSFVPGVPFSLDLEIVNSGGAFMDSQLFVALDLGTGEFWFFPSWIYYPPGIDWLDIDIPAGMNETQSIISSFTWPAGAGVFPGARFIAAVIHQGSLISNLATVSFCWDLTAQQGFSDIPTGSFFMGSPGSESCRFDREDLHMVTLTRGFRIKMTEVTQAEWMEIFAVNPSTFAGDSRPVENVTWFDACVYCNRMSARRGLTPCYYADPQFTIPFDGTPPVETGQVYWFVPANGYRLPTEAEWEYACRAGTTTPYCNGTQNLECHEEDLNLNPIAWYSSICVETQVVGLKAANAWGLHDMAGNVWEWCWDNYDTHLSVDPATDPTGPPTGSFRVRKGGSWFFGPQYCRSASRSNVHPENAEYTIGFRIVQNR